MVKNSLAYAGDRYRFNPWVGKFPWRRNWQPTPVFLLGEFHEQRSLVGYSPWGHKSQTRLKQLSTHAQRISQRLIFSKRFYSFLDFFVKK